MRTTNKSKEQKNNTNKYMRTMENEESNETRTEIQKYISKRKSMKHGPKSDGASRIKNWCFKMKQPNKQLNIVVSNSKADRIQA